MRLRFLAVAVLAIAACAPPTGPSVGVDAGVPDGGPGGPVVDPDCTPATCDELLAECGVVLDGCGGTRECGGCPGGETCGAGGPNQCAVGTCDVTTCDALGAQCGLVTDGCADVLDCGGCEGGGTCSPFLVCCQPMASCASEGAECGEIDDGCGNVLPCGECGSTERCGSVEANVCGPLCADDCPGAFSCDGEGICTGGSITGLVLDVQVPPIVTVTGTLRVNGGAVQLVDGATSGCVDVFFENRDGNDSAWTSACSYDAWNYTVDVYAGEYRVTADDDYDGSTEMPSTTLTLVDTIAVTADRELDLDADVPDIVTVTGTFTVNGADPLFVDGATAGCVDLYFANQDGLDSAWASACSYDAWQYTVDLYAGAYTITADDDYDGSTNMPYTTITIVDETQIAASAVRDLDADVPDLVTITGAFTINGADPAFVDGSTSGCVDVYFANLDGIDSTWASACSYDDWRYTVELYVGSYRITADDDYDGSTQMPSTTLTVVEQASITAAGTRDLDVDVPDLVTVSGTFTVNGADPVFVDGATSGCVDLMFANLDGLDGAWASACAYDDWHYTVELYEGAYRITADDDYDGSTEMPSTTMTLAEQTSFTANTTRDLDADVPDLVTVTGRVTMNGADIELTDGATSGCVDVYFENRSGLDSAWTSACAYDDWSYTVELYVGTYRITVDDDYDGSTALPSTPVVVHESIAISAGGARDLDAVVGGDAPTALVTVTGTVLQNGGAVQLVDGNTSGCVDLYFANLDGIDSAWASACAYDDWHYTVDVYAGTYEISADDDYDGSTELPSSPTTVVQRILLE